MDPRQAEVRWSATEWIARSGTLKLAEDRLVLESQGREVFSIPSSAWAGLEWPRYGLDATIKVQVNGQRYSVTFVPRTASLGTWYNALQEGSQWKALLRPGSVPHRWRDFILRAFMVVLKIVFLIFGLLLGLELALSPGATWLDRGFAGLVMLVVVSKTWLSFTKEPATRDAVKSESHP